MTIRPELNLLRDAAHAEVKRHGGELNLLHLATALARRWPDQFNSEFGETRADRVRAGIEARISVGDADLVETVLAGADGNDPIGRLVVSLVADMQPWLDDAEAVLPAIDPAELEPAPADARVTMATKVTSDPPRTKTSGLVEHLAADPNVRGREAVLDDLLAMLGRRCPATPLIIGRSGGGRTAVLRALATRLAAEDYTGPLAGLSVIRLRPEALVAAERAHSLRRVIGDLNEPAVLAVDDLDVIAALGSPQVDVDLLGVLRSAVDHPHLKLVMTIDERFHSRLEVANGELAAELRTVTLPSLLPAQLESIARSAATELAAYHGVEIGDAVVLAACSEPAEGVERIHPGLALDRLDEAGARSALRPNRQVEVGDLVSTPESPPS